MVGGKKVFSFIVGISSKQSVSLSVHCGNNVEAFRYYLAFEIWTISTNQDNRKMAPTSCAGYISTRKVGYILAKGVGTLSVIDWWAVQSLKCGNRRWFPASFLSYN